MPSSTDHALLDNSTWIPADVEQSWAWSEDQLRDWQLQQLNRQLQAILPTNRFYQAKFSAAQLKLTHVEQISQLPLTTKQELVASAEADSEGLSAHHTYPPVQYSRLHRTSGTTGRPLILLDTCEDWRWWSLTWQHVLQSAGVGATDRVFLAFSFGPFIGFWSAHQACVDRGATVIPGGGLSSLARLEFMRQTQPTVLCCTPSYALHLAETAIHEKIMLAELGVKRVIVAGEAGGSLPAVRKRIETVWDAQVVDHSGATEIGPWGFGWPDQPGLQIIETSFIAEFLPLEQADCEQDLSELVLTSLGRYGAPVFRYRTGDVVRRPSSGSGRCVFQWLPEGVVGRADNMVTVRGVNVFPSSIDAIVRDCTSIAEYQVIVTRTGVLDQLHIEVESDPVHQQQLEKLLTSRLGLRIPVSLVPSGSLPRSELKSRRWIDRR
jgi:phenylacetate-CoA ligase